MNSNLTVVGLSGFGKAGKTEAANYIERHYGIRRLHIATTLRKMLAELLRDNGLDEGRIYEHLEGGLKEVAIPEIGASGRHLQITLGTEWGRELVCNDLWVKTWGCVVRSMGGNVMNDSVRFPNEEDGIRDLGGFTILIERPGTGPVAFKWKRLGPLLYRHFGVLWGAHDSERVDRLFGDYVLVNDGSLEDLYDQIDAVMADRGIERVVERVAA